MMASPPLQEIFSKVILKIDPSNVQPEDLKNVKTEHKGQYLVASGTFDNINKVFQCSAAHDTYSVHSEGKHTTGYTPAGLGSAQSRSSPPAQSVEVDETVMRYIRNIKSEQFERIKRNNVVIKESRRHVTFSSLTGEYVHAELAREEFVTLYQKTATGLQTREYNLPPKLMDQLKAEFPDLLINTSGNKLLLTGSFISLERFESFLYGKSSSWNQNSNTARHHGSHNMHPVTQKYTTVDVKEETCPICLDTIKKGDCEVLPKCKHCFCKGCLKSAFQLKPTCPVCGEIYGNLTGTQPKGGTMNVSSDRSSLPGYERYGTIIINYYIPNGIQKDEHPNPGQSYEGASRTAYLPDSSEGRKVLKLLERAFDQRLTFTIGRSSTTGRNNVVTWNDVHHKTSRTGGPTHYGYPDPEYLKRVQDELKVKGIC